jgi:hypothetical protein
VAFGTHTSSVISKACVPIGTRTRVFHRAPGRLWDLVDGEADIRQLAVVEFRQAGHGAFDLELPVPAVQHLGDVALHSRKGGYVDLRRVRIESLVQPGR